MTDAKGSEIRGIDAGPVSAWLEGHVDGARAPFSFLPIEGGHSNLTYRVVDGEGKAFVLRRPPLGAVLKTAHDMAREFRIISGVGPTTVPVPPALGLCEDDSVNGAPFYVMGFVDGTVLFNAGTAEEAVALDNRTRTSASVVRILADLHAVDPDEVGLGTLGKKEDYLKRQLRRWRRQWEASKTRQLDTMEKVSEALEERMPKQIGASIVHGDYRLGNMITGSDARIAAVLDWELCTLGDPLADVGYLLNDWIEPGESTGAASSAPGPSGAPGFYSRERLITEYEQRTGRDLGGIDYYRAFQYWRLAAIVEGVLARYLKGVMQHDADTDGFRVRVEALADSAHRLLEL
jgi:aminoglycoside phosphotransferase (APT) family kinase protein